MAWLKLGTVPKKQRITIVVDAEENPFLAKMIYEIPYGCINRTVVEWLEKALQDAQGGAGTAPDIKEYPSIKRRPKVKTEVLAQPEDPVVKDEVSPLAEVMTPVVASTEPPPMTTADLDQDTARLVLGMAF